MKKFLALLLAFLLVFCCACTEQEEQQNNVEGILQVYFIDVGQADCALIIQLVMRLTLFHLLKVKTSKLLTLLLELTPTKTILAVLARLLIILP